MSTIERAASKLAKATKQTKPVNELPLAPWPETQTEQAAPAFERAAGRSEPLPISPARLTLDVEGLGKHGFATKENSRSMVAADFRRVKRPLLVNIDRDLAQQARNANPPNLVVVTSSVPNEGKTFVAINLALSIATELERSVILVDGDTGKGDVANVLGVDYRGGLVDVVERGSPDQDAVRPTNVSGLSVLPSGHKEDNVEELFASERMRSFLHRLAKQDRDHIVIIDAPPILAGTVASVLARLAGQVLMVVEAETTAQDVVTSALEQLEGSQSINLMLNKAVRRSADQINYYGYGYGYGYGESRGASQRGPSAP